MVLVIVLLIGVVLGALATLVFSVMTVQRAGIGRDLESLQAAERISRASWLATRELLDP
jgi:hypothetical protein